MGPAPIQSQSTFLANSEGALRLWALLSQDEVQAAHEPQFPHAVHFAHGVRLQDEVQAVDEEQAAHELKSAC
jgi:hypothetical protein